MPCCLGCVVAFFSVTVPRIVFAVLWIFTDYISDAYDTFVWPFLAILFLPYTGLAYAYSINTYGAVESWGLVLLILGVILDFGSHMAGWESRRRRPSET
jgi:hypothetical protein